MEHLREKNVEVELENVEINIQASEKMTIL